VIDASHVEDPNLVMLEIAAHALGYLCESLVFIGGCATGLLVTTVRAQTIRPTEDVDVVVKVATVAGYHHIEAQLAARGFQTRHIAGRADLSLDSGRRHARRHAVGTGCPEFSQPLVSDGRRYRAPR
jgi:hypothetical protein